MTVHRIQSSVFLHKPFSGFVLEMPSLDGNDRDLSECVHNLFIFYKKKSRKGKKIT